MFVVERDFADGFHSTEAMFMEISGEKRLLPGNHDNYNQSSCAFLRASTSINGNAVRSPRTISQHACARVCLSVYAVCVCMCECMYVCACVCLCMYICRYICTFIYVCIYVCMYVYIYMYV